MTEMWCVALAVLLSLWGVVVGQTTLRPAVTNTLLSTTPSACGTYNTSTCQACLPGSYSHNGTLLCSCCPGEGECVQQQACVPCERGFSQPRPAQTLCLPCQQGFYTNSSGSSLCPACPPGSYSNSSGSVTCSSCSPGFYSAQMNCTSCDPCPQGSFCNSSNCASCSLCPTGSESLQRAAKECTPCRPGMHKATAQGMCQICSSGFFQVRWGQESCDICPQNHYCPSPDVIPILCPTDAFCPAGSTAPGYCMETFFRKAGESCRLAPVTIALLVIGAGLLLLVLTLLVVRRRRDVDGELAASRAPLLREERLPSRCYGSPRGAEPVYAGW